MSARIIGVCVGLASLLLMSARYSNGQQPSAAAQAPTTGSVSTNGSANLRKRVARLERQMKPLVPLVEQLNVGARLVIPVGEHTQELIVLEKTPKGVLQRSSIPVRFVPMTGEALSR